MRFRFRELLYASNLLSLLRFLAVPIPVYAIVNGYDSLALFLVFLGILTDIADGHLARKLNQITELGKLLDPIADKLAIGALIIALWLYRSFPLWAAVLIIGRDILILFGGLILIKRHDHLPSSNLFGKLTALVWSLLVISYLTPFSTIQKLLLIIAPLMVPISIWFYFHQAGKKNNLSSSLPCSREK